MEVNKVSPVKPARLLSLDALRGFDMFWIISGEGIFHGFASVVMQKHGLVRNPVDWQIASTGDLSFMERIVIGISNQLHHSPWNGFTFYDLIFPLFIFIAGVSMPYSIGNQLERGGINQSAVKKRIYLSLIKRTLLLILFGMVVNGALAFKGFPDTRFASVLGRIALSCFFAAIIFLNCKLRGQIVWLFGILIGYWVAMMTITVPGFGSGVLSPEGNLAAYIDRVFLPGKLHRTVYDPEGLFSTVPAICSALLGVFTGQFLRYNGLGWSSFVKGILLTVAGLLLLLTGWLWGFVFPVNKNMWTSSFVLYAGGWSLLLLSLFYLIIDVAGFKKWSMPFVWVGCNSILIYMAAHGIVNFEYSSGFIFGGLINQTSVLWHSAFLWIGVAILQLTILYFLYQKKWFLKV
jgi:predicted acyltransferase